MQSDRKNNSRSVTVITHAKKSNYACDYVSLPADYGTDVYYNREDVRNINSTVFENLDALDEKTGFTGDIRGRRVIIKPNLVSVFHDSGFKDRDYPESTDPRVLDAIVEYLKKFTNRITIAESSGRGMPTRACFMLSGLDRLADRHGIELIALEEQPVDRYILPKSSVMKEIIIPEVFSEVVEGNAFYISVPKMKTNLYTGVTLGFKNAMGLLPYNLRQRNHNFNLAEKLVDILYLIKPDIVIIDGIIGGEGDCPAPLDPVNAGVIISGNNAVETDRTAARMMGFDPEEIPLIKISMERGFGDPDVETTGEETVIPFKKADPSLASDAFHEMFPGVLCLVGHHKRNAPAVNDPSLATADTALAMEHVCTGGCIPTTRVGFDFLYYEGVNRDFRLAVIIGAGAEIGGKTYYFDREGNAYGIDDIKALNCSKLAVGGCTSGLKDIVDRHIDGCMPFPNSAHAALHRMSGSHCKVIGPANKNIVRSLLCILQMHLARRRLIKAGVNIDCAIKLDDSIDKPRALTPAEEQSDYIKWDLPPLSRPEIRQKLREENRNLLKNYF